MKKTETLSFHLASSSILEGARTSGDLDASQEFSQTFIHSLGLKVESGTWSRINLDSPKFLEFLVSIMPVPLFLPLFLFPRRRKVP